jgi:predicted ferric reductase
MNNLRKYVDSLLLALFVFTGITGMMNVFRIRLGEIGELHEWAGILLVVFGLIHVFLNFKPLLFQIKQKAGLITLVLAITILSAMAFHLAHENGHEGPPEQQTEQQD